MGNEADDARSHTDCAESRIGLVLRAVRATMERFGLDPDAVHVRRTEDTSSYVDAIGIASLVLHDAAEGAVCGVAERDELEKRIRRLARDVPFRLGWEDDMRARDREIAAIIRGAEWRGVEMALAFTTADIATAETVRMHAHQLFERALSSLDELGRICEMAARQAAELRNINERRLAARGDHGE